MGRIDIKGSEDKTLARRHIELMLKYIDEYEEVKNGKHLLFKNASLFYQERQICKQNFLKYYRRYCYAGRNKQALLPQKRGRKFKQIQEYHPELVTQIQSLREFGYNRYDIAGIINNKNQTHEISPTLVYRLSRKCGINRLDIKKKETKRMIIKDFAGEMGHIDCHYLPRGIVKTHEGKLFIVGIIDDYSRACGLRLVYSLKAIDVMFASMDILLRFHKDYGINFKEIISDNGSEFASKNNPDHPFEKMLNYYGIKHRYTKPFSPQTNGKIERFWKTLEDELLQGEVFETLDELENHLFGYCVYYNQHRQHQGIKLKKPIELLHS